MHHRSLFFKPYISCLFIFKNLSRLWPQDGIPNESWGITVPRTDCAWSANMFGAARSIRIGQTCHHSNMPHCIRHCIPSVKAPWNIPVSCLDCVSRETVRCCQQLSMAQKIQKASPAKRARKTIRRTVIPYHSLSMRWTNLQKHLQIFNLIITYHHCFKLRMQHLGEPSPCFTLQIRQMQWTTSSAGHVTWRASWYVSSMPCSMPSLVQALEGWTGQWWPPEKFGSMISIHDTSICNLSYVIMTCQQSLIILKQS